MEQFEKRLEKLLSDFILLWRLIVKATFQISTILFAPAGKGIFAFWLSGSEAKADPWEQVGSAGFAEIENYLSLCNAAL